MDSRLELINLQRATVFIVFVATCLLIINNADIARAAPGDLDPNFGTDGEVITSIGTGNDEAHALAIQPLDGKIVVAGWSEQNGTHDIALVRYNSNGVVDTGFGTNGVVTTFIGSGDDEAEAVAIQSDGKIVVAGRTQQGTFDIALVRYNSNGVVDTGFGTNGVVTTFIGSGDDEAKAVAIQSDGKIVVAGRSEQSGSFDFVVVRYNPDGSLDNSGFGINGKVTTPVGGNDDGAESIAIQSDNKVVVAGHSLIAGTDDIALVRYNINGGQDTSFGNGGFVTTSVGVSNDEAYGVALQSDGKIVVAGRSEQSGTSDIALARYEATSGSSGGGNTSVPGGGGGGCTLNPRGGFDFSLVSLMGLMLVYLGWKVFRRRLIK